MQQAKRVTELRRLPDVCQQTGMSRATIYRKIGEGTFPAPVKLGARASAWVASEIDAWVAQRITDRQAA
jgi:predicted DNA-binding transcriptional regulator AlpA